MKVTVTMQMLNTHILTVCVLVFCLHLWLLFFCVPRVVSRFLLASIGLPVATSFSDIYYRDNIGNVSTSTVRYSLQGVELTLLSRFPVYGGWKNSWYQGYNLPTEVRKTPRRRDAQVP